MNILNLYARIGRNRKFWDKVLKKSGITAVELVPEITQIYSDLYQMIKLLSVMHTSI